MTNLKITESDHEDVQKIGLHRSRVETGLFGGVRTFLPWLTPGVVWGGGGGRKEGGATQEGKTSRTSAKRAQEAAGNTKERGEIATNRPAARGQMKIETSWSAGVDNLFAPRT